MRMIVSASSHDRPGVSLHEIAVARPRALRLDRGAARFAPAPIRIRRGSGRPPAGKGTMRRQTVHVIGAGFSGLSAALHLSAPASGEIVVHEGAAQAGGRRRSFFDDATRMTVDSGPALVLSGWRAVMTLIEIIGARGQWRDAAPGGIAFVDMASGERWTVRPNRGPLPLWIVNPRRRPPRTH